ncbi:MAG TPA: MAPEG family protein [Beijerinckiaceae bacterium]|jgi:hypothetical protein|nr:MAPEG family protein [Beijerinckiaceae bacterium]
MIQIFNIYEFRAALVYVALLILGNVALAAGVIRQRQRSKVSIGDGDDPLLRQWIRAHGNYCENVPFGIVALVLLPLVGASAWIVHIVGLCLVVGRLAHAQGLTTTAGESTGRLVGAALTWLALIVGALTLLWCVLT